jgi:hypothetical protein
MWLPKISKLDTFRPRAFGEKAFYIARFADWAWTLKLLDEIAATVARVIKITRIAIPIVPAGLRTGEAMSFI